MHNILLIYKSLLRQVSLLIFLSAISFFSCKEGKQSASDVKSSNELNNLLFYIGSYADAKEPGIYLYEYDKVNVEFNKIQELNGQDNPSFLAIDPTAGYLFAVNQTADFEGKNEGAVAAFSIDKNTGMLSFINRQSSLGARPCHISVLPDGRHVAVANYTGGSITVLPVAANGYLEKASAFVQHEGSGPDQRRQSGPHAHSVYPSLQGNHIFAADLGIDKIMIYKIDKSGSLSPNMPSASVNMAPGAGPRHMAFHPEGKWIYVINELNSTVTGLVFDSKSGKISAMESVSTLPGDYDEVNYCADIHVHPGGKFLYASNRGHNSIAIFEIAPGGMPVLIGHEPVRGEWPRNFNIEPSGKLLFVANQNSDNITLFNIDPVTGKLNFTGKELQIKNPVCIVFLQ